MICSATPFIVSAVEHDLESAAGRLRAARIKAGYDDAADFARAVGVKPVTYRAHEGGQNGFARYADRYGVKLKVSPLWLLYGKGDQRGVLSDAPWLPRLETIAVLMEGVARALSATRVSQADIQGVSGDFLAALRRIAERPDREDIPEVLQLMADQIAGKDDPRPPSTSARENHK